jgi:hypothetical protein
VAKLSVTVDLLLGNIPERTSFLLPGLKAALAPYLQLAQVFATLLLCYQYFGSGTAWIRIDLALLDPDSYWAC